MFRRGSSRLRAWMSLAVFLSLMLPLMSADLRAQEPGHIGLVQDWSAHHALYGRRGPAEAITAAAHDPRAVQAWRSAALASARVPLPAENTQGTNAALNRFRAALTQRKPSNTHIDWSIDLGSSGTASAMYPAKFSFDINATPDCTKDYVVYPVNQTPSSTQENLVAFNNLYSGTVPANGICNRTATASDTGTSATVMWSYAIQSSDSAGVMTSPVLSMDGTKVAFVTSKAGAQPRLHVLAWKSGDGMNAANLQDPSGATRIISTFSATAPSAGSGAATDLAFGASGASAGDTLASPYIDYINDMAYIGDDLGNLVRIKDVFCPAFNPDCSGTPPAPSLDTTWGSGGTVVVGSGSCAGTANAKLTGPVVDFNTGNVFVGCADGKLYGFNSSGTPLANSPATIGNNSATGGLVDPPVVDGVNGFVYAFSGNDGTHAVAVQTKIDLSAPQSAAVGKGGIFHLHAGAFNDPYFSSATSTNWFLNVQGYNGGGTQTFLYAIGFNASRTMNTTTANSLNAHPTASECSPMTEFLNGGTDRLFFGQLQANALVAYNITTVPPAPTLIGNVTEQGGTSGIIVDNVSTSAQASSMYFSTLGSQACGVGGTGRCAVKLTQSGLQ